MREITPQKKKSHERKGQKFRIENRDMKPPSGVKSAGFVFNRPEIELLHSLFGPESIDRLSLKI